MLRLQADPSFLDSRTTLDIVLILGGVAVAALLVAGAAFRIRSRWLLAATLVLGVAQIFGPFGFTSGALLATCTLFPVAAWRTRRELRDIGSATTIWALLLAALAVWQVVSVLWSAKLGSAGYGVIFSVALLTVFLLARDLIARDPGGLPAAITAASPVVILAALATVAFRLWPHLEGAYLLSPLAHLFTEPDVVFVSQTEIDIALDPIGSLGLFADAPQPEGPFDDVIIPMDPTGFQNVLDPSKAGGVFLNGNTAALFFAIAACVAVWALFAGRRRILLSLTIVSAVAALVATGSKTALLLLVALPVVALVVAFAVRRPRSGAIVGAIAVLVGAGGAGAVAATFPGMLSNGTMGDRFTLWRMVAESFPERWFLGFGFGNWRDHIVDVWQRYFPDVATQIWPPHNLLLQAWVDAGLISLLLTLALVVLSFVGSLRRIGEARRLPILGRDTLRAGVVFVALAWVFLHGMADTTFFAGDNHTLPFVAVLTALALTPSRKVESAPSPASDRAATA